MTWSADALLLLELHAQALVPREGGGEVLAQAAGHDAAGLRFGAAAGERPQEHAAREGDGAARAGPGDLDLDAAELCEGLGGVAEALGGLALHARHDEVLERRREARAHLGRAAAGRTVEDRHADLGERVPGEGQLPGHDVIEHGAQREDVAAGVEFVAAYLLGAHVEHRSHEHPVLGDAALAGGARDAEVEELQVAVVLQQDVRRLEVAVDQLSLVDDLERGAQLQRDAQALLVAEGLVLDDLVEGAALEVLHRDVRRALEAVVLEDRRDVRVIELRRVLRLALEPLVGLWVDLRVGAEDLQGDRPAQLRVHRAIDLAERTFAEAVRLRVEVEVGEAHGGLGEGAGAPAEGAPRPYRVTSFLRTSGAGVSCARSRGIPVRSCSGREEGSRCGEGQRRWLARRRLIDRRFGSDPLCSALRR